MKRTASILILGWLILLGCNNNNGSTTAGKSNDDTAHFFQTAVIFSKDLHEVDSTPFYIYKIEVVNGKRDSVQINAAELKALAQTFLQPDITSDDLKPKYKQSIFEDQTMNALTINYTALDKDVEVQSEDILMKEDGKTITNIFIRKFHDYGDSTALEQLNWKPGNQFRIVRSVKKKDNTENNYQTTVVWNPKSEPEIQ